MPAESVAGLISRSFELQAAEEAASEEDLMLLLADRIAEMLEQRPDYLMSLLYRLDVLEEKIRPVMRPGLEEPVQLALARLVLERQKQRADTKRSIKPESLGSEWEW